MSCNVCCPTNIQAVVSNYVPKAQMETIGGLDSYVAPAANTKCGVVAVTDIFGMSGQAKQFCDKMAGAGFYTIAPDVCQLSSSGKAWDVSNFPPADWAPFKEWVGSLTYEACEKTIQSAYDYLKSKGCENIFIVGFCWGAMIAVKAAQTGKYKAAGGPHPSFLDVDNMKKVQCPIILLPSKDDDDTMKGIKEALDSTPYGAKSFIEKFPNMHHGWVAARGDYSVPEQAAAATKAINLIADFFCKNCQ